MHIYGSGRPCVYVKSVLAPAVGKVFSILLQHVLVGLITVCLTSIILTLHVTTQARKRRWITLCCLICRVGQNRAHIELARIIYIRCVYGMFGRKITKGKRYVHGILGRKIYGQRRRIYTVLASPVYIPVYFGTHLLYFQCTRKYRYTLYV